MKKILIGLLILMVGGIALITYLGFMPGLSLILAKPKDLGVTANPELVQQFDTEFGMVNELPEGKVPEGREPSYEGSVEVKTTLTSEQITSILDYWRKQYANTPIREVQVRFNPDGTGEASGILEIGTAVMMAKQLGYNDEDIAKGKQYVSLVAGDLPFYIKGKASMTNNQLSIEPETAQLGRVTLPGGLVQPVISVVEDSIERRIGQVPGAYVRSLTFPDGRLHLDATMPTTVK